MDLQFRNVSLVGENCTVDPRTRTADTSQPHLPETPEEDRGVGTGECKGTAVVSYCSL